MGRYGAGKGTQATMLIEALKKKDPSFKALHVETGNEFRKYTKEASYTAQMTKSTIDSGGLMPEFMCVYMWARLIADTYTGKESLVFDGTPRKLLEAKMLGPLFEFYGLSKPWLIYLDVQHEESSKRLMLRAKSSGRADDGEEQIKKRKHFYETDIVPTVDYYRTSPLVKFLDIDGERSVEAVHADIVKSIGLA